MACSSGRSSSTTSSVHCNCGLEAHVQTSFTLSNPGRRFAGCPNYKEKQCKFFKWLEPDVCCDRAREVAKLASERITSLKMSNAGLDATNAHLLHNCDTLRERIRQLEGKSEMLKCCLQESRLRERSMQNSLKRYKHLVTVLMCIGVVCFAFLYSNSTGLRRSVGMHILMP